MNPDQQKQNTVEHLVKPFAHAALLDSVMKPHERSLIRGLLGIALAVIIFSLLTGVGRGTGAAADMRTEGVFFLLATVWLVMILFEFFYNSSLFSVPEDRGSYLLAGLVLLSMEEGKEGSVRKDPTAIFLRSEAGIWILARAGISPASVKAFLENRGQAGQAGHAGQATVGAGIGAIASSSNAPTSLAEYLAALIAADEQFKQFILASGAEKSDLTGAAEWYERRSAAIFRLRRWWSRDTLSRIPGLAKDWAYGDTFYLDQFSSDLLLRRETSDAEARSAVVARDEYTIETVLSRSRDANAIVIGPEGAEGGESYEAMEIIFLLARNIRDGTAQPEIEHRRLLAFDTTALIDATKEKTAFEQKFISLLDEAVRSGNIILFFEHLPKFIEDAHAIGSDVASLLDPYLASSDLRILALADRQAYHQFIEQNAILAGKLEKIQLKEAGTEGLNHLIEHEIEQYEAAARRNIFFTYGAVHQLADSITQYFGGDFNANKARDLLAELVSRIKHSDGKKSFMLISKADVLSLVGEKTGIPLGEIAAGEREKLLNLESLLHARIISQNEAVNAIANAMRRARSGIANPSRPIGSFLFLGPTGVGKTETAKALAATFFNNENQILRIDMSEYSGSDALSRLIGVQGSGAVRTDGGAQPGQPGILASMLRDKQYGVLLLDEFEKGARAVHDLFLQILDEGYFSDINGNRVNARNTIIIATSNAGSDMIFKEIQSGATGTSGVTGAALESKKQEVIDAIVAQGIFRPELLNRFDGIILFHPLERADLEKIVTLQLKKLSARIEQKGVTLAVTPDLLTYLVGLGSNPRFGAREMNRAIQETVEQIIARKIIAGEAPPGSTISLTAADFVAIPAKGV